MRNIHERHIGASAERVGAVLETLATDDDQLWPGAAWAPMVRWADDALVEDAFAFAETALSVGPAVAARWSPRVRLLHTARSAATDRADVRQVETPTVLISAAGLARVDFTDTFALRLPPGSSRDVGHWHRTLISAGSPAWVSALMAVRNRVVKRLGLDTGGGLSDTSPFTELTRIGDTLVVGEDDKHLDFRGVLRVVGDELQCATVVHEHTATGRAYFTIVKPFHRRIVPALLRRASAGAPT